MGRLILHIGTHKTATTTIQDTFYANSQKLGDLGLIYPVFGAHSGHHCLVTDWRSRPAAYAIDGGPVEGLATVADRHASDDRTVFLSSEEFSRPAALSDLGRVRDALAAFDSVEVVCVLRAQWQFVQSVYAEVSKTRLPPRPPAMVETAIADGQADGLWVDYTRILDGLQSTFDPDRITFLDYDVLRHGKSGVVGGIFRQARIAVPPRSLKRVNGGRSNVSAPPLAIWAASIASEPAPAPDWLVRRTSEALIKEFGEATKTTLFTRSEYNRLRDHFGAANDRLRDRIGATSVDLPLDFPALDDFDVYREDIGSGFWAQVTRQLVKGVSESAA